MTWSNVWDALLIGEQHGLLGGPFTDNPAQYERAELVRKVEADKRLDALTDEVARLESTSDRFQSLLSDYSNCIEERDTHHSARLLVEGTFAMVAAERDALITTLAATKLIMSELHIESAELKAENERLAQINRGLSDTKNEFVVWNARLEEERDALGQQVDAVLADIGRLTCERDAAREALTLHLDALGKAGAEAKFAASLEGCWRERCDALQQQVDAPTGKEAGQ